MSTSLPLSTDPQVVTARIEGARLGLCALSCSGHHAHKITPPLIPSAAWRESRRSGFGRGSWFGTR